ncbi:hypothetical protein RN001_011764 [Aquatica leii]|uniref:Ebony n=1 Tax=Aquatica leii TaxID=1421715 RepID=A0AAN7SCZ6_9COLE|nr:hypothetical protein RN001_011764 [Aquatica leii]
MEHHPESSVAVEHVSRYHEKPQQRNRSAVRENSTRRAYSRGKSGSRHQAFNVINIKDFDNLASKDEIIDLDNFIESDHDTQNEESALENEEEIIDDEKEVLYIFFFDFRKMGTVPQLSVLKGRTRTLIPKQIHRLFEEAAKNNPSAIALMFEENGIVRKYTYFELDNITNSLAKVIRQTIVDNNIPRNNDGDFVVAVCMYPTDYLVITLLSIWKSGAAYLPLDPTFPESRVEHIVREAKPALVIFDEDNGYFTNIFKISRSNLFNAASAFETTSLSDDEVLKHLKNNLAMLIYTSGSTGSPKGVRLPHVMILNRLQWQFKTFPYSNTETICVFKTALTFVDSVSEIWGPLINGRTLLVVPKFVTQNPEELVSVLEKYKIERLVLVPSLLRSLLMYFNLHKNKTFLPNLKTWVCSGETLVVSLAKDFYNYFSAEHHQLCNFYGSTEIMGDVTYHVITKPEQLNIEDKIPIGLPIDNTIIYLLDSEFRPVRAGEVGELFVAGANLADGYVNGRDPDKFIENPLAVDPAYMKLYRTGDFARIIKGTVMYEGRTDSQIKIRGYRVDIAEVEKAVNAIDGVDKAVVLCYKPGEMNQTILAFVLTETSINEHQIETILKNTLPSYMVPQVILIDAIPLLVNGKTDRQALFKYYETSDDNNNDAVNFQVNINYAGVPERQKEAAKILFETVASVLNKSARKTISVDANFFEIGGNSLNSIFTITCLNEHGYHISISDFIAAADLGEVLDRMFPEKLEHPILITQPPCYTAESLQNEHKKDVFEIITSSFYQKADLEKWIITELSESDYVDMLEKMWNDLLKKQLSFIVKTETGKSVGVSLNFDARDEPEPQIESKLLIIFDLLESIEGPVRDKELPEGIGKILHSFMMGTNSSLTPKENVAVIQFMEEEVIRIASLKNFAGILTTNTNPLTQQLGTSMYGYKTYLDYQVNQFVASDGTKPFGLAPDSQRALVQWKEI